MKYLLWGVAALAVAAAGPTATGVAADSKPIDTKQLVIKPTKAIADLAAATINLAGNTAAGQIEQNGYVKTFNNLFRKPTPATVQAGPSPLPAPYMFPSTRYPNYNTPVMPTTMRRR